MYVFIDVCLLKYVSILLAVQFVATNFLRLIKCTFVLSLWQITPSLPPSYLCLPKTFPSCPPYKYVLIFQWVWVYIGVSM